METVLITLVDDRWSWNQSGASILALLDLSEVFDIVDHGIPLDWLSGFRIVGIVILYFLGGGESFQLMLVGGSLSTMLLCGISQDSTLSPLLLNIYMEPPGKVIY